MVKSDLSRRHGYAQQMERSAVVENANSVTMLGGAGQEVETHFVAPVLILALTIIRRKIMEF